MFPSLHINYTSLNLLLKRKKEEKKKEEKEHQGNWHSYFNKVLSLLHSKKCTRQNPAQYNNVYQVIFLSFSSVWEIGIYCLLKSKTNLETSKVIFEVPLAILPIEVMWKKKMTKIS